MQENDKKYIEPLFSFLSNGISPFHVVRTSQQLLDQSGFQPLDIHTPWILDKPGRYYCKPYDSELFAFTIGENSDLDDGIRIAGCHTDFPGLKIKPNPEHIKNGYLQLNVEVYGGPVLNTFLDRPLSIAGKVAIKGKDPFHPDTRFFSSEKALLTIPNLAIHMNPKVNDGVPLNPQAHLLPLLGMVDGQLNEDGYFIRLLADALNTQPDHILDFELFVYGMEQPCTIGIQDDFVSSPRLDNLTSVCALVQGLIHSKRTAGVNLIALFDNEEVGSRGKQGADSQMLGIITEKIWLGFGAGRERYLTEFLKSMILSADVAHGYHPNYPEASDPVNRTLLNQGFDIKTSANQSYAWDCEAVACIVDLCRQNGLPFQRFTKNSNQKGGSTISSMISSHLPVRTVDIGIPLLAMHSIRELMGTKDYIAFARLIEAFFRA